MQVSHLDTPPLGPFDPIPTPAWHHSGDRVLRSRDRMLRSRSCLPFTMCFPALLSSTVQPRPLSRMSHLESPPHLHVIV